MFVRSLAAAIARSLVPCLLLISGGCEPPVDPTHASEVFLTALSPNRGSTGGGAWVVVTGSGFRRGQIPALAPPAVTLGGIRVAGVTMRPGSEGNVALYFRTPAHAAGTLDLVVTNDGDFPATLPAAYTYAPPASFDFNGEWSGYLEGGSAHEHLTFTIRNNLLVTISCDTDYEEETTLTIASPTSTSSGEFSHTNLYARIVSANEAAGTISLPPCVGSWVGGRRDG